MVVAGEVIRCRQDFESARKKEAVNLMTRYGWGAEQKKEKVETDLKRYLSVNNSCSLGPQHPRMGITY